MKSKDTAQTTNAHRRHYANLRLERWHRWCVYVNCAWLIVAGVQFLVGHFILRPTSEFGDGIHPLEPWSMGLHGGGAMVILFFLGSLMK
jgi:hypothetical protein